MGRQVNKVAYNPIAKPQHLQATRMFTDREEPREVFWTNYEKVKNDEDIRVVVYYGIGGIGKTSLLKELEYEISMHKDRPKVVIHDFEDCHESYMAMRAIKLQLEKDYNFEFPCFDIGLYAYLKICGCDMEEPKIKTFLDRNPKVNGLLEFLGLLGTYYAPIGVVAQGIKAADIFVADYRNKKLNNHEADLKAIKTIKGKEKLLKYLTYLFVQDMRDNLKNNKKPFIVMFDTYEKLVNELTDTGTSIGADDWIRGDEGIVNNIPGVLWVIAGREDINWDESWKDNLDKHLLGDLDEKDVYEFLRKAKIEDKKGLYKHLYNVTHGVPVYLDLCVQRYFDTIKQGGKITNDKFGKDDVQLIKRYIRDMDRSVKQVVRVMSCLGRWTEDMAIQVASKAISGFDEDLYDDVVGLSIISVPVCDVNPPLFSSTIINMHPVIAKAFYDNCPKRLKAKADKSAMEYCLKKTIEYGVFSVEYSFYLEQLMQYVLHYYKEKVDDEKLKDYYLKNIDAQLRYLSDLGRKTFVNSVFNNFYERAEKSDNELLHAEAIYSLSYFLRNGGEYSEAIKLLDFVITIFEKYPDCKERYFRARLSKVNCLIDCGKYPKAYIEVGCLQKDYHDSEKNIDSLNVFLMFDIYTAITTIQLYLKEYVLAESNIRFMIKTCRGSKKETLQSLLLKGQLAIALYGQKKYKEAIHVGEEYKEGCIHNYTDDNPRTIAAKSNLASAYLGDYTSDNRNIDSLKMSLSLSNEVIEKQIKMYGENHPESIKYMHNLTINLIFAKDYKEALKWGKRALENQNKRKDKNIDETVNMMSNMVEIYDELKMNDKKILMEKEIEKIYLSLDKAMKYLQEEKYKDAFEWLKKAANEGHPLAKYKLGIMYYCGQGIEPNLKEAFKWLKQAAEDGNSDAQYSLGVMYMNGQGTEEDYDNGLWWIMEAAKHGDYHAQMQLAEWYYYEKISGGDKSDAVEWGRKAAEQGGVEAQSFLGAICLADEDIQDYEEAFKWLKKASEQGDAVAQYNLGQMYWYGVYVEKDDEEALKWINKAAEQGEEAAINILNNLEDKSGGKK